MSKETDVLEATAEVIEDLIDEGVSVYIPRKTAVMLFGAVIVANVATVFVLSGITRLAKKFVVTTEEDGEKGSVD